jgi:hypothetical protein
VERNNNHENTKENENTKTATEEDLGLLFRAFDVFRAFVIAFLL